METLIRHNDQEYELLKAHIQNTNTTLKNGATAPYKKIWNELSIADNRLILLKAGRIVIARNQRKAIRITCWDHVDHENGKPTLLLARYDGRYQGHNKCMQTLPGAKTSTTKKPIKLTPIAHTVPMQNVGTDLYSLDKEDHLVFVDRYSGSVSYTHLTLPATP